MSDRNAVGERFTLYAAKHHLAHAGDVGIGDELDAAIQLFMAGFGRHDGPAAKSATQLEWNRYAVAGEIVFRGAKSVIVDFGVPVGWPLELLSEADFLPRDAVRGEVMLAWLDDWPSKYERAAEEQWIDEDLSQPSAPPLTCRWQVERIWLNTTPWHEIFPGGFGPIPGAKRTYARIERTDWAADHAHNAQYFIECRLLRLPA